MTTTTTHEPEHKKQLHAQIEERKKALETTLAALAKDPAKAMRDRVTGIEAALAALETHISGGWSTVGTQESAALVRWLDTSRFLFDAAAVASEAPAPNVLVPTPLPVAAPIAAPVAAPAAKPTTV